MVRRSHRDGLGSASQAPRGRASGTNGVTDVPVVGQRCGTQGPSPGPVTAWPVMAGGGVWVCSVTLTWFLLVWGETQEPGLRVTTWSGGLSATALTRFHKWAGGVLLGTPHCLAREEEGSDPVMHGTPLSSSWDPETEETALLLKFWVPLAAAPGEGVTISRQQFPPSLGRPSQGLLHLRLPPGLAGAWTGWASCLWPAPRRRTVEGCCRGVGAGAATGGAHGDEQAEELQPQWKQQRVSSGTWCAWSPQSASVLPKTAGHSSRQRRRRGRSVTREHSGTVPSPAPSCQWDTARDGAPGPQAWTLHDPETVRSPSSLGARGPSQHAAHVEPPGRAHPRARTGNEGNNSHWLSKIGQ